MEHAEQVKLLTRLFELRDAKSTSMAPDVRVQCTDVYVSPDQCSREIETLFRRTPLIAGLAGDLPHAGDYFTVELGRSSVLVVRSENAGIRAFLNACRHRGARVAEGRGAGNRVFRCPYHAWVYDLDGQLLGQPVAKTGFQQIDPARTGLIELPAAEVCGLLLVGATPGATVDDPAGHFDGLGGELDSHGFESWTQIGERDASWRMNWKLPYETFLEAYHIFSLHKDSLAKEVLATPMLSEFFGRHGRGLLTGREALKLLELPQDEWTFRNRANLVYWLFPNTVLSMPMTGHAELWQFYPGATAGECRVHTRFYLPEEPASDKAWSFWNRMVEYTMGVVESEDFGQQEAIQHNVESGIYPQRVFGRNEPALIHYHQQLDDALGTDTSVALR